MTYTELVAAIKSYAENYETEFAANIPVFVTQAETRIYNTVQIPALRKNVTGITTFIPWFLHKHMGVDYADFYSKFYDYMMQDAWFANEINESHFS